MKHQASLPRQVLLLTLVCGLFATCAQYAIGSGSLAWQPPVLTSPRHIALNAQNDNLDLDSHQDYVLEMPEQKKLGYVRLSGGRNIVLIGGWSTIPSGVSHQDVNFQILDKPDTVEGRIVHIEGVRIDGSGGGTSDAFRINAPKTVVQLLRIRATGIVYDTKLRAHSDVIQTSGGCKELRLDYFTGSSQFQGLYLAQDRGPNGKLDLRHVNIRGEGPRKIVLLAIGGAINSPKTNGKRLFELCDVPLINLQEVYLKPNTPQDAASQVLPNGGTNRNPACQAKVSADGKILDWPDLRNQVTGVVNLGDPPGGDFVPEGVVGLDYAPSK